MSAPAPAAPGPACPDMSIAVKIYASPSNVRVQLPLRKLLIDVLESELRAALRLAPSTTIRVERYSDSARSWIHLDPANLSVYKQLFRAAKAKQKVKFRVTQPLAATASGAALPPNPAAQPPAAVVDEPAASPKVVPKPATVEDVPEPALESPPSHTLPIRSAPASAAAPEPAEPVGADATSSPCKRAAPADEDATEDKQASSPVAEEPAPATAPAKKPRLEDFALSVCCNLCHRNMFMHWHCSTCDDGDFDMCGQCFEKKKWCPGNHDLTERYLEGSRMINLLTLKSSYRRRHLAKSEENAGAKPDEAENKAVSSSENPAAPAPAPASKPVVQQVPTKPTAAPAVNAEAPPEPRTVKTSPSVPEDGLATWSKQSATIRTCNSCVCERPGYHFMHCLSCDDFDLCAKCYVGDKHGHHPLHAFEPVDGTWLSAGLMADSLREARTPFNALCDGCDDPIYTVRHKCLDCPDFDYCSGCISRAPVEHPGHRFAPLIEPIPTAGRFRPAVHKHIRCDGPLCKDAIGGPQIFGTRYKCAVCHDTDFCASCEASPLNKHNKSHPLIKIPAPIAHVQVTTHGQANDGSPLTMGDVTAKPLPLWTVPAPVAVEKTQHIAATPVRTVAALAPLEHPNAAPNEQAAFDADVAAVEKEFASIKATIEARAASLRATRDLLANRLNLPRRPLEDPPTHALAQPFAAPSPRQLKKPPVTTPVLSAYFVSDFTTGNVDVEAGQLFMHTWVVRNDGDLAWPSQCSVKYTGGAYMGHCDPSRPASVSDVMSASGSYANADAVLPGCTHHFAVTLRAPARPGKSTSYWRLTAPDGSRFGPRLWCDITTKERTRRGSDHVSCTAALLDAAAVDGAGADPTEPDTEPAKAAPADPVMIFPRVAESVSAVSTDLAKSVSALADAKSDIVTPSREPEAKPAPSADSRAAEEFETLSGDDWADDDSMGFLTDEEYDILDASDEDFGDKHI